MIKFIEKVCVEEYIICDICGKKMEFSTKCDCCGKHICTNGCFEACITRGNALSSNCKEYSYCKKCWSIFNFYEPKIKKCHEQINVLYEKWKQVCIKNNKESD